MALQPPPPAHYYSNYESNDHTQQQYLTNYLQDELNHSLARESSLILQLDNLTSAFVVMEEREELHMRQLDVLTERLIDVEAQAAEDRCFLAELEGNCTASGNTIGDLQEDLDEWQKKCQEYQKRHEDDKKMLAELQKAIKDKQAESEELAIAMEQLRMIEKRKNVNYPARISQKQGGLIGWVLSWFGMGGDIERYDGEIREESYEMAKSTLLQALQTERSNVHELEATVASLQQNNSAISEMVESRDMIIDELNSRIAVFEEDKVVLKAALRQLQKEMNEDAPKTQKLLDDLSDAEKEIDRLKADINSIIGTHQEELVALQATISQKQKKINDAESNLTAIGTYVDKLEDRLTSFAITRRDIEDREKKCKEIEQAAQETDKKRISLQAQVKEYQLQEEDLKRLLEELATERTNLQKENRKLCTEREFRIGEQEVLESKLKILGSEKKSLEEELQAYELKCENLLSELKNSKESSLELEVKLQTLQQKQDTLQSIQNENQLLLEKIDKITDELSAAIEKNAEQEGTNVNMTKEFTGAEEAGEISEESTKYKSAAMLSSESKTQDESSRGRPPLSTRNGQPASSSPTDRNIPLRSVRKALSKATGLHGVITPSSKMVQKAGPGNGRITQK